MARSPTAAPVTHAHELTVAMIGELVRDYTKQRRAAVDELIQIEKGRHEGQRETPPPTDVEQAVRNRALSLINGFGNADDFLPPAASRAQQLQIEIDALDMVCGSLRARETRQRGVEAAQWLQDHGDEWRRLVRDILLTAVRLQMLEAKAAAMKLGQIALPLDQHVGTRSVLNVNWSHEPLSRPLHDARAAGIITDAEVEAVSNA